jgi:hypothetical protein
LIHGREVAALRVDKTKERMIKEVRVNGELVIDSSDDLDEVDYSNNQWWYGISGAGGQAGNNQ